MLVVKKLGATVYRGFDVDVFPVYGTQAVGEIPPFLETVCDLLPFLWCCRELYETEKIIFTNKEQMINKADHEGLRSRVV